MTSFVPLLSVTVEHAYFGVGRCSPFDFVPTHECATTMRKNNLLLRSVDNGLKVFCRNDQIGELRRAANKDKDLLMLEFKVFPRDRRFAQYTSPIAPNQDAILYFDSWRAVRDQEGRLRLHSGDVVTADFFEDWRSPLIQTAVTAKEHVIRPFFIVNLAINDIGENLPDGQTVTVPQKATTYYLNFASQASYWKYYFLGDIASRDLFIADLSGAMEFTRLGIADVVNGKALAFLSTASIPMQYIPSQRFQLRENGAMGEKVLIKRLPNASVGQIHKEMIKQDAVLVSEMYIN